MSNPEFSLSSLVQRHQLADQVIERLRERIARGQVEVGQKLPPEPSLAAQFGVGRSTIREAVRVLAHSGLLEVRQGDGTYVRATVTEVEPLSARLRRARVREVNEVRRALELETARLAALRRDEHDLALMRDALRRRRQAVELGQADAMLDADVDFHLAIARATKNAVLADLYQTFARALRGSLGELVALAGMRPERGLVHEQLGEALARGDPDAAQELTADILDNISRSVADQDGPLS